MSLSRGSLTTALTCLVLSAYTHSASAQQTSLLHDELSIEQVVEDYSLDGDGVLIAIIGEGLDFQLNDFRRPDGSTRIESILDLTNNTGATAPANPVGRGTVYTSEEIQLAIAGSDSSIIKDPYGSSTGIAGIIAGFADDTAGRAFRGLAPEASLIIVKTHELGIPGDQEGVNQNPGLLYSAIEYVALRAEALSMPTAVFIGSQTMGGPTDGSSRASALIDAFSASGHPRMIFVTATGETEGIANHAAGSVNPGSTTSIEIAKNQESSLLFDLWYPTLDSEGQLLPALRVSITDPDGIEYGPYSPSLPEAFLSDRSAPGVFDLFHRSDAFDLSRADNGKRQLLIQLKGKSGLYSVSLELASAASEAIDFQATLNSSWRTGSSPSEFATSRASGTTTDVASTESALVVNGYSLGTEWVDMEDQPRADTPANGAEGELLAIANRGVTFDGRDPVDFAVPAGSVFGPLPPDSYLAEDPSNLIKSGLGRYGAIQENRVAAGLATGVVALMLQIDPHLSAHEAKSHFIATAVKDAFTGEAPGPEWGSGKMDASAALNRVALYSAVKGKSPIISAFAPGDTGPREISIETKLNFHYTLQYSADLTLSSWIDVSDTIPGDGAVLNFVVPEENELISKTGFFRICVTQTSE